MKSYCVIGLGNFGQAIARSLLESGKQVMIIDIDPVKVNALADIVTDAVIGDATSETFLKESGIKNYDCAINCLYKDLNDSIMVTLLLKEFGIKKIVARAGSVRQKDVLDKLGADMVVFPEYDMGMRLGEVLVRKNVHDYIEIYDGYCFVELDVPGKWLGKNLIQLQLRKKFGLTIVAVRTGNGEIFVSPDPERPFEKGDEISVIGKNKDIDKLTV